MAPASSRTMWLFISGNESRESVCFVVFVASMEFLIFCRLR
jgi:hypothetical protein